VEELIINNYKEKYLNQVFENIQEKFRKRKIISLLENNFQPTMNVCEIGCGRDSIFNYIEPANDMTIIEPQSEFLKLQPDFINKKQVNKINNKLEKVSALFKNRFELVILSGLIHEVEDPVNFLRHVREVSSENGLIVITTNNTKSIHRLIGLEMGELLDINELSNTARYFNQYSGSIMTSNILDMCKKVGFRVDSYGTFMPKILPHSIMQELITNEVINIDFIESLYAIGEAGVLNDFGSEIFLVVKNTP